MIELTANGGAGKAGSISSRHKAQEAGTGKHSALATGRSTVACIQAKDHWWANR